EGASGRTASASAGAEQDADARDGAAGGARDPETREERAARRARWVAARRAVQAAREREEGEARGGEDAPRGLASIDAQIAGGALDEARASLDALSEAERRGPAARMSAARLHLAAGAPARAVQELEPLGDRPDAPAPLLALYGRALLAAGEAERAAEAFASSEARDAALPEALLGRAQMAVRARSPREALYHIRRLDLLLRDDPRPSSFRAELELLRGRALLQAGRTVSARRVLRRLVGTSDAPTAAHFHYAQSEVGHDHVAARRAFERYLELAPDGRFAGRARHALGREGP
ncbi:MAG TPA: hypothetical protein RMH99_28040, partial [Sandaracinaceae bacterium LLY-WYZ-13_1]|nr:hypothetical protein [Sandaracinaceae bacterium LLY-WYZ-13_1]